MKLSCKGDYELQKAWMEQHKNAILEYDTEADLPSRAIYINPIYQAYVLDPKAFFAEVRRLMDKEAD